MKVVILNGLLKKEREEKKILDVITRELENRGIYFEKIDIYDWELPMYTGESNAVIDKIFNDFLSADGIMLISSVYFNNISITLKNVLDYFQISKYKVALKSKYVVPVVLHNDSKYIDAYGMLLSFIDEMEMLELNKIILKIPERIDAKYIEKNYDIIKLGLQELCDKLSPIKMKEELNNEKLNVMLETEAEKVDTKNLKLELDNSVETDIKKLTTMVNEKLTVQKIVEEADESNKVKDKIDDAKEKTNDRTIENDYKKTSSKEDNIKEITTKYKSKIEEIMQLTLGEEDEEEDNGLVIDDNSSFGFEKQVEVEDIIVENDNNKDQDNNDNENLDDGEKTHDVDLDEAKDKVQDMLIDEKNSKLSDFDTNTAYPKVSVTPSLTAEEQSKEYIRNLVFKRNEITKRKEENLAKQMSDNAKQPINDLIVKTPIQERMEAFIKPTFQERKVEKTIDESASLEQEKERSVDIDKKEVQSILLEPVSDFKRNEELITKDNDLQTTNDLSETTQEAHEEIVEISKFKFDEFHEDHEVIPFVELNSDDNVRGAKNELLEMTKSLIYLFKAPENEVLNFITQLNITGDDSMNLIITIQENKCSILEGINKESNLTIDVTSDKWQRILSGEVTLQSAFMTGMIKVSGNFVMLNKLDKALFGNVH